jgi:hypothetical protein
MTHSKKAIQDGHRRIKGIKEAAQGTVGQGFYPTEFVIMGSPCFVCGEERLQQEIGYGLPFAEQIDNQEQVPIAQHQRLVRPTERSKSVLQD